MSKGSFIFVALAGGGLGSMLTWYYTKKYYEQIADEEIASIKERYEPKQSIKEEEESKTSTPIKETETIDTIKDYKTVVKSNYGGYFNKKEEDKKVSNDPYVISPEDFDTIEEYGTVSLTYFADGYLVDEAEDQLYEAEDIAASVGEDFMNHIGEYEPDSVHIRNDDTETDYEILTDLRRYQDVLEDRRH